MYYQLFTHQHILREITWLVTCNRILVNIDSVCLIKMKVQFFDIIAKLLCILRIGNFSMVINRSDFLGNFSMVINRSDFLGNFDLLQLCKNRYIYDVILKDFQSPGFSPVFTYCHIIPFLSCILLTRFFINCSDDHFHESSVTQVNFQFMQLIFLLNKEQVLPSL